MGIERFYLTDKGANLLAKAQTGKLITYTKAQIGDGFVPSGTAITSLTALVSPLKALNLAKLSISQKQAIVEIDFNNQGLSPFWWMEVGLFANDPDEGEILYAYGNAGTHEKADYIALALAEFQFNMIMSIQNASNVTAVIDESLIYSKKTEFDSHVEDLVLHITQAERTSWNAKADNSAMVSALDGKVDKVSGKGLTTNDFTGVLKDKLSGVAENANNYVHPSVHPADVISETADKRFVSDSEKNNWNSKISISDTDYYKAVAVKSGNNINFTFNYPVSSNSYTFTFKATFDFSGSDTYSISNVPYALKDLNGEVVEDGWKASAVVSLTVDSAGKKLFFKGGKGGEARVDYVFKIINRNTLTPLSVARGGLSSSTDGNGNVLFGGGGGTYFATVDKYDKNGNRTTITSLSVARGGLSSSTDGNGNVLFGGGGAGQNYYATVEKYDKNGNRTTLESLNFGRGGLSSSTDGNGSVLFGGGTDERGSGYPTVDKYDKNGNRITLTSLSVARRWLSSSTDGNGSVLFGGGFGTNNYLATVDKYDSNGNRTTLTSLYASRDDLASSTDGNGNVLFGGGTNCAVVDKYDKNGNKTTLETLNFERRLLTSSTDGNGNVLFGGGAGYTNNYLATVDKYDKNGNKIATESLSAARQSLASSTDGNGSVLFGGGYRADNSHFSTVDKYDKNYTYFKDLLIPQGSKYKFTSNTTEQTAITNTTLTFTSSDTGYVKYKKATVTI